MVSQHKELPATFLSPALTPSATHERQREHAQRAVRLHAPVVGIVAVWRDALANFNTHSVAILLCACLGIAAPIVVAKAIDTLARLSAHARAESAAAIAVIYDASSSSIVLAGAIAGVFGLTLARGVITWIALYGDTHGSTSGQAIRATITHFPALLAGTLLYGLLVTAGIIGLSELSQHVEYRRDRALHMWMELSPAFGDGLHQVAWRGFNGLIPNPGPPFAEFMPSLRQAVVFAPAAAHAKTVRIEDVLSANGSGHTFEHTAPSASRPGAYPGWTSSTAFPFLALGSVILIVLAETLLRFRTIMALNPSGFWGYSLLAPLFASARFGVRHFGQITIHVWVMRLAILALILALVEFPLAIMDHLVMPNVLRFPIPLAIVPALDFLATSGAALVSAILIAFSVVYDARLYHYLNDVEMISTARATPFSA